MIEQRRHQRIRFGEPPVVRIGYGGQMGDGFIENLSMSGLMLRCGMQLAIGRSIGCEFSLFGSPVVDMPVTVVSRVGDLFGARFQPGLISQILIEDGIKSTLASGQGAILSVNELAGRKVMRITGGLSGALRNDFMHALTRVGVDEVDVGAVTSVDQAGLALCLVATGRHGAIMGAQSDCFAGAWKQALAMPGNLESPIS